MAVIGSLSVKLGLVTVEWDQATDKAKKQAKDLQDSFNKLGGGLRDLWNNFKALGGVAALTTVGLVELARSTMEYAAGIKDLSQEYGISIEKTMQFRHALEQSGASAESSNRILTTLFSKIEEAKTGNEAAIYSFEKIGISFEEITKLSPDQAIDRTYKALSKMGDSFQRIQAVKELLGKGGLRGNVEEMNVVLEQSVKQFEADREAVEAFDKSEKALQATGENLKRAFMELFDFIHIGAMSVTELKAAMIALGSFMIIKGVLEFIVLFKQVLTLIQASAVAMSVLDALTGNWVGLAAGVAAAAASIAFFNSESQKVKDVKVPGQIGHVDPTTQVGPNFDANAAKAEAFHRREIDAAKAKVELILKQVDYEKQATDLKIKGLDTDKYLIGIQQAKLTYSEEIAKIDSQRLIDLGKEKLTAAQKDEIEKTASATKLLALQKEKDAIAFINAERLKELETIQRQIDFARQLSVFDSKALDVEHDKALMTTHEYTLLNETLDIQKKRVETEQKLADLKAKNAGNLDSAVYQAEKKQIEDAMSIEEDLHNKRVLYANEDDIRRQSWSYGWSVAYKKYQEDAANAAQMSENLFNSMAQGMEDALTKFIRTGTLDFKSFANMMLDEIARIQAKLLASKIFDMMNMGSGGGIGGFISGLFNFGGSPGAYTHSVFSAGGNELSGGQPSMVGENGPEMFIPKSAGTIVPNNRVNSLMGNQPQVVYNGPYIANMSAIDTQSGLQFLAKNKQGVWAANQSAQRALPQSR